MDDNDRSVSPIYQVTRGLRILLRSQLEKIVEAPVVSLQPPGGELPEGPGVNLYLYRVAESAAGRNLPWRGDRQTPSAATPALNLVLSYLLTPLRVKGHEAMAEIGDDAHTMLGMAMLTLHENPVLTRTHIDGFDADVVLPQFFHDSYETVAIALQQLSVDELSKIAAPVSQPYRLSVAYEVSLVQLTPRGAPPVRGGMVLATNASVFTRERPAVSEIAPSSGPLAKFTGGSITPSTIIVKGSGFRTPSGAPTAIVAGKAAKIQSATASELAIELPSDITGGPSIDVTVAVGGERAIPVPYTIDPWLASSLPLRTTLESSAALKITGRGFVYPAEVRFEGRENGVVVTSGNPDEFEVPLPQDLPNGLHAVRVICGDAVSNRRMLEVIPRIDPPVEVVLDGTVHTLTFHGARLHGADIRLIVDGTTYAVRSPSDTAGTSLVIPLNRALAAGPHTVALDIDGSRSRAVEVSV